MTNRLTELKDGVKTWSVESIRCLEITFVLINQQCSQKEIQYVCVLLTRCWVGSCGSLKLCLRAHQFVCGWKKARRHSRPPARPRQLGSSLSVAAHCSLRQPYYVRTPAVIIQHTPGRMHALVITHHHPNACLLGFCPRVLSNWATAGATRPWQKERVAIFDISIKLLCQDGGNVLSGGRKAPLL